MARLAGELHEITTKGDAGRLRALLRKHPEIRDAPHPSDSTCTSALHTAAFWGRHECTAVLLAAGCDPAVTTSRGRTALHVAASRGHKQCCQALLVACGDGGASLLRMREEHGWTALQMAAMAGRDSVLGLLLARGVEDQDGGGALLLATDKGQAASVHAILAAGCVSPDARGAMQQTALHKAAAAGQLDILRALVGSGASLAAADQEGRSPLHAAAAAGQLPALHALLASGADLDAADSLGRTPLHAAVLAQQAECAQALLQAGAGVDATERRSGATPLILAAELGDEASVQVLLAAGAAVDAATHRSRDDQAAAAAAGAAVQVPWSGQTALMKAAARGHLGCLRALLRAGASLELGAVRGWTALHFGAHSGRTECVEALLEAGADADARSHGAARPLMLAASGGHEACVRALIRGGAAVDARAHKGKTAVHLAAASSQEACLQALIAAGASPNSADFRGRTPLQIVAEQGSEGCLAALLQAGGDPGAADKSGTTPMHRAAAASRLLVIQRLATAGAELAPVDSQGATPRDVAVQAGNSAAASLLEELERAASRSCSSSAASTIVSEDPLLLWVQHQLAARLHLSTGSEALRSRELRWDELQIQGRLGAGSFAKVFLASYHHTQVAVKVLCGQGGGAAAQALSFADAALDELRREALLLANLHHPNLVQLLGVCVFPAALVMDYCSRGSLLDVLRRAAASPAAARQLTWVHRLNLALGVAKGLLYLHTRQPPVLHRDLKSANCLVDGSWRVKVADFNLSKAVPEGCADSLSTVFAALNPRWLAPEVLEGSPASRASDVYSYGVVLWELLTWRVPWPNLSQAQQWRLPLDIVAGARPQIPPAAELPGEDTAKFAGLDAYIALMRRCWAAAPADRPSFDEIIPQLRAMLRGLTGQPTAAPAAATQAAAAPATATQAAAAPGSPMAVNGGG